MEMFVEKNLCIIQLGRAKADDFVKSSAFFVQKNREILHSFNKKEILDFTRKIYTGVSLGKKGRNKDRMKNRRRS